MDEQEKQRLEQQKQVAAHFVALERHEEQDHDGVSQVVIERFVKYRLPILTDIKREVDQGHELSEGELEILGRMITRSGDLSRFAYDYPEFKELVAKIVDLLHDITGEALANARDRH